VKTTGVRFAAVLAFATCAVLSVSALTGFDSDYDAARERAKASGRHMMLFFTGSDWCKWCKRLEKEVFVKPEFLSSATNEFELVVLDFPKDKTKQTDAQRKRCDELARKFRVRGYPAVKVIDAVDESVVCASGYIKGGAVKWLEDLHKRMKLSALYKASLGPLRDEVGRILGRELKATVEIGQIFSKETPLSKGDKEKLDAFRKTLVECIQDYKKLAEKVKAAKIPEEIEESRKRFLEDLEECINDREFDPLIKDLEERLEGERGKGQKQEERKP